MSDLIPIHEDMFDMAVIAGQIAPSSVRIYRMAVDGYYEFAGSTSEAVKSTTLAKWRQHLVAQGYAAATINTRLSAIKSVMAHAADQGFLTHDAAHAFTGVASVSAKALKSRQRIGNRKRISREQLEALLTAPDCRTPIGLRDAAIMLTLASTGVRNTELCTMRVDALEQIDGDWFVWIVGKNHIEPRAVPLAPRAHAAMQCWLHARKVTSDYLFVGQDSNRQTFRTDPMTWVTLWQIVRKYAERCGIRGVKPHDFRRYAITEITRLHGLRSAQQLAGHADPRTTSHYDLSELQGGMTNGLV